MARKKLYANAAERQRAYRERLKRPDVPTPEAQPKKWTRPQRFKRAQKTLEDLSAEYQNWLETLPENLSGSEQAGHLKETIEQFQEVLSILEDIELPRGFGR